MDITMNDDSQSSSLCLQMQIGLPITGKYRDPESDQYYNHNDVSFRQTISQWISGRRRRGRKINFNENMVQIGR